LFYRRRILASCEAIDFLLNKYCPTSRGIHSTRTDFINLSFSVGIYLAGYEVSCQKA
jgi:hypothetical protein